MVSRDIFAWKKSRDVEAATRERERCLPSQALIDLSNIGWRLARSFKRFTDCARYASIPRCIHGVEAGDRCYLCQP